MKRILLTDAKPGMKLAKTLFHPYGGTLLAAGVALTPRQIELLARYGYASIFVSDGLTDDIEPQELIEAEARVGAVRKIQDRFDDIRKKVSSVLDPAELREASAKTISQKMGTTDVVRMVRQAKLQETFIDEVRDIVESLLSESAVCVCVQSIRSMTSFLFDHSLDVAVYSLLLGRRMGFRKGELFELALGCLMHDMGYLFVPEDLLRKTPDTLTEEERAVLRQHTTLGYHFLRNDSNIGLLAAHIAYQHHERQDGKGYPRGLKGSNKIPTKQEALFEGAGTIHRYADLVAIANRYDYLLTDLPFKPGVPPDQVVAHIRAGIGTEFNKEAAEAFLSIVPVFPIGTDVVVEGGPYGGYRGTVIGVKPLSLDRPKVRFFSRKGGKLREPVEVDFSIEKEGSLRAI